MSHQLASFMSSLSWCAGIHLAKISLQVMITDPSNNSNTTFYRSDWSHDHICYSALGASVIRSYTWSVTRHVLFVYLVSHWTNGKRLDEAVLFVYEMSSVHVVSESMLFRYCPNF